MVLNLLRHHHHDKYICVEDRDRQSTEDSKRNRYLLIVFDKGGEGVQGASELGRQVGADNLQTAGNLHSEQCCQMSLLGAK